MEPKKTRKVRSDKGIKRATYKKRAIGIKRGPYKKRTAEQQLERRIKISWNNFVREGKKLKDLNLISAKKFYTLCDYRVYRRSYLDNINNPYVAVEGNNMTLQQKKNSRDNIRINYVIRAGKIRINKTTGEFLTREERILVPMHKFFIKNISKDDMYESQRKYYTKLRYASQQLKDYDLSNVDTDSYLYRNITTYKRLSDDLDRIENYIDNGGVVVKMMTREKYNGSTVVRMMMEAGFSKQEAIAEAHARGFNS